MPYPWEQLPREVIGALDQLAIPPPSVLNPSVPWAPPPSITIYGPYVPPTTPSEPPPAGGPEDRAPPTDFDTPPAQPPPTQPPPSEPPPAQPPAEAPPPPVEGEYIPAPRGPVVFDDEGFPSYGYDTEGPYSRRQIDVDPYGLTRRIVERGIGRIILGPIGGALPSVLEPEVLGSGTLPFPPIPRVNIPAPRVSLPEPTLPPLAQPPTPELTLPAPPDVIVVTPGESSWPQSSVPSVSTPSSVPASTTVPGAPTGLPWWALVSAAVTARATRPRLAPSPISAPIPRQLPSPETPPSDPLTPPRVDLVSDPLTPVEPGPLGSPTPLVSGAGSPLIPSQTETTEDRCRCRKCKEPKKKRRSPSSIVASVQPFSRRMSTYSLKNLRRGGGFGKLKRH